MQKLILRSAVFLLLVFTAFRTDVLLTWSGINDLTWRPQVHALLQSLAWFAGAAVTIAAIDKFFWDYFVARLTKRPVPPLLKKVSATVVYILALTSIVGIVFGRDVTGIWATSGAIGIVLGLALRGIIQDVFSGIVMNVDGAFKAGDWVQLHSANFPGHGYGKILDIAWRTTTIKLENNNVLVVPNSMMGMMAVTNFAHADHVSRLETEIVIDFDVPPERARRILLAGAQAAVAAKGIIADPPPAVIVGESTENGVVYKVRFWGKVSESSPSTMQDAVMTQLLGHLRIAGLTPAFPKEDVFIERRPKRLLSHDLSVDRAEVLSRIDLFSRTLERGEIERLADSIEATTFVAGQELVRQGDEGRSLFVVAEGIVDVYLAQPGIAEPLLVNRVGAGQIFGEMSLLTHEPRSASVVASTSVLAYEIKQEHFEQVLASRPAIAEQLSAIIASKRTLTDAALRQSAVLDVERETIRLKEQLLERMRSVFLGVLDKCSTNLG